MNSLTRALAAEHTTFDGAIAELRRLADDCGDEQPASLVVAVDGVLAFLEQEVIPHADAEDAVLYPAVARLLGAPLSTATMRRDHEEIRRLTAELRHHRRELATALHLSAVREVRRLLYSLHAVLALHVAKEEEVYFPLLDAELGAEEADGLLHRVRAAASAVHDPARGGSPAPV